LHITAQLSTAQHSQPPARRRRDDRERTERGVVTHLSSSSLSVIRYAAVVQHIGTQGVVELVHTMGHYCNVSMSLNVFNVPLPDGAGLHFEELPHLDGGGGPSGRSKL
jgi:hypothetical protein